MGLNRDLFIDNRIKNDHLCTKKCPYSSDCILYSVGGHTQTTRTVGKINHLHVTSVF